MYVEPEAAITVFELQMMGGESPETCSRIKKHWNNKFYCKVASCWFLYQVSGYSEVSVILTNMHAFTGVLCGSVCIVPFRSA
jgi:hypothetical protein